MVVQGQPQCNRHTRREKAAGRASQEQCGFRRRKPMQMRIREIREGFMEKVFVPILKAWTDRNEICPKQKELYGRRL